MHKEALRYLRNAKEILRAAPVKDNIYADIKPVREAMGMAYLAILEAIDECLREKGITEKEFPTSVEAYRKALRRHLAVHDGKLMAQFEDLYRTLHIAGHYRGLIRNTEVIREALKAAQRFIEKIR